MTDLLHKTGDLEYEFKALVKTSSTKFAIKIYSDSMDIQVTAPPVRGKANKEIIKALAEILAIQSTQIWISRGLKSSTKKIRIRGYEKTYLLEQLTKSQLTQMMQ